MEKTVDMDELLVKLNRLSELSGFIHYDNEKTKKDKNTIKKIIKKVKDGNTFELFES